MDFSSEEQLFLATCRLGEVPVKTEENKKVYEKLVSLLKVTYQSQLHLFAQGKTTKADLDGFKSMYIEYKYRLPIGIIKSLFGDEGVMGDPENEVFILEQINSAKQLMELFDKPLAV